MTTANAESSSSARPETPEYAAFIGIDWAKKEHVVDLQLAGQPGVVERRTLAQAPAALRQWADSLRQRFSGRAVAVAIETNRGPLISALMCCEFIDIYPINPKSLARFRQSFRPSGAKDDRSDAELLRRFLRSYYDQLKPWKPDDAATRALGGLNEIRRDWVDQVTASVLRLENRLQAYYPVAAELFAGQLDTAMACRFLERWPNLAALKKASPQTLRKFFTKQGSRSESKIQERLEQIKQAEPLTEDFGVIAPAQADVQTLVKLLLVLLEQIEVLERQITERFIAHPDAFIFQSLPGAGKVMAPRLLAAFGTDRTKFPKAQSMQQLCGVAPVTIASGQSKSVHARYAAPRFLRQTFWEFAKCSLLFCPWAKAVVDALVAKGKRFNVAVRVVAFKWIRIIWRIWQNHQSYDEATYLEALERKNSPYFKQAGAGASPAKPL